jgi:PAS domain S-box-containing protein
MLNEMLNQGLLAITFFKASTLLILLILFFLLNRDSPRRFLRIWLAGWGCLTLYAFAQVAYIIAASTVARIIRVESSIAAGGLLFAAVLSYAGRPVHWKALGAVVGIAGICAGVAEYRLVGLSHSVSWWTALSGSAFALAAGFLLWHVTARNGDYGPRLLAGAFLLGGLHNIDRAIWMRYPHFELRVALSNLFEVAIGVAMVVVVLEATRGRTEELNDKLRRLSLITAASTQSLQVERALNDVLHHVVESLNASHGLVRLLEGQGDDAQLVIRAAVGFDPEYLRLHGRVSASESATRRALQQDSPCILYSQEEGTEIRQRLHDETVSTLVVVRLPGKEGPLGILGIGSRSPRKFQADEVQFLLNVANLLGLTIQNVTLFEQVSRAQKEWARTFDSIDDPVLVHNPQGQILRCNVKLAGSLGKIPQEIAGRTVSEVFRRGAQRWTVCPYCEEVLGEGDHPDPSLGGRYLLASNSAFHGPAGESWGTVHVLKDITDRKQAEERYRNLIENVQEGVFISTPEGRFLDFNEAFMRMLGYEKREELLDVDIAPAIYLNPGDRERLQKLLREHGSVHNFEFQLRRPDGEIRTVLESSFVSRNAAGVVTGIQGFALDITERKLAEQEIRRRNRELMVLNSIGQTLSQSHELKEMLGRALRQIVELFSVDVGVMYLLDEQTLMVRPVAGVGQRSDYARNFPPTPVPASLVEQIRQARATVLSVQSLPLPEEFRELDRQEGVQVSHAVVLWGKDRILGGMVVGCRSKREFSAPDLNLLTAVGNQLAASIEKSLLLQETKQAYEHLRHTQEQLLQSAKMAAVGQLISGVAHELNNPLTAILGYSQLLSSGETSSALASTYVEKLYRQAQRTQRIVQNLLSFARQQKTERHPVNLNQVLEDTLALREYDLRVSNIQVHRELGPGLPWTSADSHQLQQVFLNILNNAVDAVLSSANHGEIWVQTCVEEGELIVRLSDSGPGVKDASRVFDPFYTTKPVGKGTGLGLSICYGIIHEHGGEITVTNKPPRGAMFSIRLRPIPTSAVGAQSESLYAGMPELGRVLLVDDEVAVLELELEILKGRCQSVRTTQDAAGALELLKREHFDLVVTDCKMPGPFPGRELYRWILSNRPELANRVIFTMSDASEEDVKGLLDENGCSFIQKPFAVGKFLEVIRATLERSAGGVLKR